jgi:hemolysin D
VVTTGQQLVIVVPRGTKLEVEVNLLNRDKGFVHEGQVVRIKVETFDFTKYGVIDGAVTNVSNDAVSLGQETAG